MKKVGKYILWLVACVIVFAGIWGCVELFKGTEASSRKITGRWQAQEAGYNLFGGKTTLVRIKSRVSAENKSDTFLVAYDESRRALICHSFNKKDDNYLCQPVLLNKDKVEKTDNVGTIAAMMLDDIPLMVVMFERNGNELVIKGVVSTDEECLKQKKCEYLLLSRLKKYGIWENWFR